MTSTIQVTVAAGSTQSDIIAASSALYGYAQTVFSQLSTMFHGKVTVGSISSIVLQGMLAIKDYAGIAGSDKKTIVIQAILLLVEAEPLDPATKTLLAMVVNTLGPPLIDDLYWAGEQAVKFQRTHGCFGWCKPKPSPTPSPAPAPAPAPTPSPAPAPAPAPLQTRRQQHQLR